MFVYVFLGGEGLLGELRSCAVLLNHSEEWAGICLPAKRKQTKECVNWFTVIATFPQTMEL